MGDAVADDGPFQDLRWSYLLAVGVPFLLWLIPSLGYVQRFTGQVGLLVLPIIAFSVIIALAALGRGLRVDLSKLWLVALFLATTALFIVLYPIANSGLLGPGSDRDDALNVALQALLAGDYPYGVTTYLGNSPTPMPGALILALPFYLLGNSAFQNLVWLPVFIWWCLSYFKGTTTAFIFLAIFLLGCPASLGDFVTGGDYLVNSLYVIIAMDAAIRAQGAKLGWSRYAAYVFLGIVISSRPIYVMAPIILAGSIYQEFGSRRMFEFLAVVAFVCLAINAPFFLYDPQRFPTTHLSEKLATLPQFIHASIMLPILGAVVAARSFFVPISHHGAFGLMAVALAAMFYPVIIYEIVVRGLDIDTFWTASYSLPVTIFAGIWICGRYGRERPGLTWAESRAQSY